MYRRERHMRTQRCACGEQEGGFAEQNPASAFRLARRMRGVQQAEIPPRAVRRGVVEEARGRPADRSGSLRGEYAQSGTGSDSVPSRLAEVCGRCQTCSAVKTMQSTGNSTHTHTHTHTITHTHTHTITPSHTHTHTITHTPLRDGIVQQTVGARRLLEIGHARVGFLLKILSVAILMRPIFTVQLRATAFPW
jgi:hypothetical protein